MKFSIITPVNVWTEERKQQLQRAVESVAKQTFRDFEHIIVNDGSPMEFELPKYDWLKVINVPHNERVIAANVGLNEAKGDWICFLDSDDEYDPLYLEKVNKMIEDNPNYKVFNFGCKYIHKDGTESTRGEFRPKKKKVGHEMFGGGNIVKGTYVFSKACWEEIGGFPPEVVHDIDCTEINYGGVRDLHMNTPFDFSAMAQIEFPEIRAYFMVDHVNEPNKIIKELGNPWGDDYYLFYKLTRKYHSKPIKEHLYIVYPK